MVWWFCLLTAFAFPAAAAAAPPMLAAGTGHSLALANSGSLLAWGNDSYGQLGLGRALSRVSPGLISGVTGVRQLATGFGHVVVLKTDGTVWTWGDNDHGQLGSGDTSNRSAPAQVAGLADVAAIAAGDGHTVALKSDGTVWAWGWNIWGQLGDGTNTDRYIPVAMPGVGNVGAIAAGTVGTVALKRDGKVMGWGGNGNEKSLGGLSDVVAIAAGSHTLALKSDGTVWAWGDNQVGQVGDGTTITRGDPLPIPGLTGVAAISAGAGVSMALKSDGTVWAWGWALGNDGKATNRSSPTLVPDLNNVASVAAGWYFNVALKTDGTVWTWGYNNFGQLGDGTTNGRISPTLVPGLTATAIAAGGYYYMFAQRTDGTVWGWGNNDFGQLGDGAITIRSSPVPVPGLTTVAAIAAAHHHSFALMGDGSVWGWGYNLDGQLGGGSDTKTDRSTPAPVNGLSNVAAIAPGYRHTLALKPDGVVWSWGRNDQDQLGHGTTPENYVNLGIVSDLTSIAAVASGGYHSLALKNDGRVWAWGYNGYGQLGDGTTTTRARPSPVPGLTNVAYIAAGGYASFAIKNDGTVWAWGRNDCGQLGDGTTTNRTSPMLLPGLNGVSAIAAGDGFSPFDSRCGHTVALKTNGTVWAWGNDDHGQLGDGNASNRLIPGPVPTLANVVAIAAGDSFSVALKQDGIVVAWGANDSGQVGDGTFSDRLTATFVVNDTATGFLSLTGTSFDNSLDPYKVLQVVSKTGSDLNTRLTDLRATGFTGDIYFAALLPRTSPIVSKREQRDGSVGMVPVTFTRTGYKQTGPSAAAEASASGAITSGNQYTVYEKVGSDPLANSNAIICMGLALPGLSAKGQVLMRAIATGDQVKGVVQCPTVQTPATIQIYTAETSGPITAKTIIAMINPLAEHRGQVKNVYSWAVAPDGTQFMQTGPNNWSLMAEPMLPAMTVTVPATGSISLPVINGLDLSALPGTLVYAGMGSSWDEVRNLNQAGHYYTVQ